ncbi:MAG: DUF1003 domain-containing protein [Nanoarchaeota archaeon]
MKPEEKHPINRHKWGIIQKTEDFLAKFAGSWGFILFLIIFIILWVIINLYGFIYKSDPYPFIFLNLILNIITVIIAPIILMSQNRESQRDRVRAEYDYKINKKAELEIEQLKKQLDKIERRMR